MYLTFEVKDPHLCSLRRQTEFGELYLARGLLALHQRCRSAAKDLVRSIRNIH